MSGAVSGGGRAVRWLLAEACAALGQPSDVAEQWSERFEQEWLEELSQLRRLQAADWERLGVPVGLKSEIQRRLGMGRDKSCAGGAFAQVGRVPRSNGAEGPCDGHGLGGPGGRGYDQRYGRRCGYDYVPGGGGHLLRPEPRSASPPRGRRPGSAPAAGQRGIHPGAGGTVWRPPAELEALRKELWRVAERGGEPWPVVLLDALRVRREENGVDADILQSALRAVGMKRVTPAQLRAALSVAAPRGGAPSTDAVISAIYGPLPAARDRAVRAVFSALDSDDNGRIPVATLLRRINVLEHPGVQAGRIAGEDVMKGLVAQWDLKTSVTADDFSAAHVLVSVMFLGDDIDFSRLVRKMWRMPHDENTVSVAAPATGISYGRLGYSPSPYWAHRDVKPLNFKDRRREPDPPPTTVEPGVDGVDGGGWWPMPDEDVSPPRMAARRRAAEAAIRRSGRASTLLGRIRFALRQLGCDTFATLSRRYRSARDRQGGAIDVEEFQDLLNSIGVGAASADLFELLRAMDLDCRGAVHFEELLSVIRGPLTPARLLVVREAWGMLLDADGGGGHNVVSSQTLQAMYVPAAHPDAEARRRSQREVLLDFLAEFGNAAEVHFNQFHSYYEGVSAGIEKDTYFAYFVRSTWGLETQSQGQRARNKHYDRNGSLRATYGGLAGW